MRFKRAWRHLALICGDNFYFLFRVLKVKLALTISRFELFWNRMVQLGQIFEFVKLVLFMQSYLQGGRAPYSQTLGSSLIPPGCRSQPGLWSAHCSNGFDELKNLTNSDIAFWNYNTINQIKWIIKTNKPLHRPSRGSTVIEHWHRHPKVKGLSPAGSLLIPLAAKASRENDLSTAWMDSMNSKIWSTRTLPYAITT